MSRSTWIALSLVAAALASGAAVSQHPRSASAQPARPSARATFQVNSNSIGACLRTVTPNRAAVDAAVTLDGSRFGAPGNVQFSSGASFVNANPPSPSWTPASITGAHVPAADASGSVRVNPSGASFPSNELFFGVLGSGGGSGDPEACAGPLECGNDSDCTTAPANPVFYGCAVRRTPTCCQLRPQVAAASPSHGDSSVCVNNVPDIQFNVSMDPSSAHVNDSTVLFQRQSGAAWVDVAADKRVAGDHLVVSPRNCSPLLPSNTYRVVVVGGESGDNFRSRNGVSLNCNTSWATGALGTCQGSSYVLQFAVDAAGCLDTASQLTTFPVRQSVGIAEAATFNGVTRSSRGRAICTPHIDWSLPVPPTLAGVTLAPGPGTSVIATAGLATGQTLVHGSVTGPSGLLGSDSTLVVTAGAPHVDQNSSCSAEQSPAPRPNRADACTNSLIQARFTVPMDAATLALRVYRCNSGASFDVASCGASPIAGTPTPQPRVISFTPSGSLAPDTWYQATVPAGALSDASIGHQPLGAFSWHFKTRSAADICEFDAIEVAPNTQSFSAIGETHSFMSSPVNHAQCAPVTLPPSASWQPWTAVPAGIVSVASSGGTATAQALANGQAQLQARLGGFSGVGTATLNVSLPLPLRLGVVTGGICRNSTIRAEFTRPLDPSTVENNVLLQQSNDGVAWANVPATVSVGGASNGGSAVTLTPPGLLGTTTWYRLKVNGRSAGIHDTLGQNLTDPDGSEPLFDLVYLGGTPPAVPSREVCRIDRVIISRAGRPIGDDTFLCGGANNCRGDDDGSTAGNQHQFHAEARAASGDTVSARIAWSLAGGAGLASLNPAAPVGPNATLTAGNQTGNAILVANATDPTPADSLDYGSARGSVDIRLLMCTNPWPSIRADGSWAPFVDSNTGFSMFYCRDDGDRATTTDDLPALPNPTRRNRDGGDMFREIIFLPGGSGGEVSGGNNPPIIDYIPDMTVNENELLTFNVSAHDPENDSISFATGPSFNPLLWSPASPLGPQLLNLGSNALFTWRPNGNQAGEYTLVVRVRDSVGAMGSSRAIAVHVIENSAIAPPPPAPAGLTVSMDVSGPTFAHGNLTWHRSSFAETYRVYRRDAGPAGSGDPVIGVRPSLRLALQTIRRWFTSLVPPLARLWNTPVSYAAAADIDPSGAYVELSGADLQVYPVLDADPASCSGTTCHDRDNRAPVSRHLCYAIKACNSTGCSGFSNQACADAPPPNDPPVVTFTQPLPPPSPIQRVPVAPQRYTFMAHLSEPDAGDHLASYQWVVDGSPQSAQPGSGSDMDVSFDWGFAVPGLHTVALRPLDSHGASPTPDPSVQVDAEANVPPAACIVNPSGVLPAWCTP